MCTWHELCAFLKLWHSPNSLSLQRLLFNWRNSNVNTKIYFAVFLSHCYQEYSSVYETSQLSAILVHFCILSLFSDNSWLLSRKWRMRKNMTPVDLWIMHRNVWTTIFKTNLLNITLTISILEKLECPRWNKFSRDNLKKNRSIT